MSEYNKIKYNEDNEDYKDVERFKFGIWIAKTFALFVMFIVSTFVVSYVYVSISTQQLADLNAAGALLGGFFEVIKTVISPTAP
jgi:hypothetical protein